MKIPSMDGETSSMDESAILGCHLWISSMDGEVSSMDGEMSFMDESVIRGCHPWMEVPSVNSIHGWITHIHG